MNKLYGNMVLDDELMHQNDQHPQFNESALLTIFDVESVSGGYLRIGNRPNEGHAEATFCWFLPDGSALFSFERAHIEDNLQFRTEKISVETVEVGESMTASFHGSAHHLASPRMLVDPKQAFTSSPAVNVDMGLTLTGVSPMYGGTPFPGLDVGGHYEQHMRVAGTLRTDTLDLAINGYGNRDHSWGPRVWQGTACDRTMWCTFGDDFGLATSLTWRDHFPDVYEVIGYVWRDGAMTRIVDASMHSEYEDERRLFHSAFQMRLHLENGTSLEVDGNARAMAPLRHRRGELTTHIGWAMAEFRCEGRVGMGLSEYMDQAKS